MRVAKSRLYFLTWRNDRNWGNKQRNGLLGKKENNNFDHGHHRRKKKEEIWLKNWQIGKLVDKEKQHLKVVIMSHNKNKVFVEKCALLFNSY